MKILIVGCGSIGTRRAKILVEMGHEVLGSDTCWPLDGGWVADDWCKETGAVAAHHPSITEVLDLPQDAVLICTPPDSDRAVQIRQFLTLNIGGLFVEKPLATSGEDLGHPQASDNISAALWAPREPGDILAKPADTITMGACNLRFTPGIDDLRKVKGSPLYGRFTMGQHSKYWSKDHKPLSMILDSIHELDLAVSLLGPITSIRGRSDEQTAMVSVHHEGGNSSQISLDRVHEPPVRIASVESPEDGLAIEVKTDDGMYEREMRHFLDCVEKGESTCNPLEQAAETCRWALEIA